MAACRLATLLIVTLPFGSATANDTVDGYRQQIEKTDALLQQLDAELEQSRVLKAKLQSAVENNTSKFNERKNRIAGLDKDIQTYNAQLEKLEQRVATQLQHIESRKLVLAESLRNTQRISGGSGLKVLLQHDSPAMAERLSVYTDHFMRAQKQSIELQMAALTKIELAQAEALKNRNWLHHIKKKASSQRDKHKLKRAAQNTELGQVDKDISAKSRTVAQLKADQSRLQTLMEELKAAQIARSGYFASKKGALELPVVGDIDAHFGDTKSVGKIRWNGLFIRAKAGQAVHSVADGEIMYSDWLQGFGMLVIVDHGDSYMTLYGGNRDVTVARGDWVDSGSTIATVGDSGGQKNSGLYFEIRHNAKPVDPESWLATDFGGKTAKN